MTKHEKSSRPCPQHTHTHHHHHNHHRRRHRRHPDCSKAVVLLLFVLCVALWLPAASFFVFFLFFFFVFFFPCYIMLVVVLICLVGPVCYLIPWWRRRSWLLCFSVVCGSCTVCLGLFALPLEVIGSYVLWLWLFLHITKTCLYNFDPLKPQFYIVKLGFTGVYIIFLISAQKHRLWVFVRTASARRF